jgi:hypothetical protein
MAGSWTSQCKIARPGQATTEFLCCTCSTSTPWQNNNPRYDDDIHSIVDAIAVRIPTWKAGLLTAEPGFRYKKSGSSNIHRKLSNLDVSLKIIIFMLA